MTINKPLSFSHAFLTALIILQVTMLTSMFTQTVPHPPLTIPFFALGPFLGASISVAVMALILGATETRGGAIMSVLAAILALISFGPQKWLDPAMPLIWPAILLGQIAVAALIISAFTQFRGKAAST